MHPRNPLPFPWRSLEATSRGEVSVLRNVKRWATSHVRVDEFAAALRDLLGADLELRIGRAQPLASSRPIDGGVGVVIARADVADMTRSALIEVEGALAANVVARALKRPAPILVNPAIAPSDGLAGAFAAVVVAAARRAHAGIALRVLAAGPVRALEGNVARLDPEPWSLSLTVLVARDAFAARVLISRDVALTSIASRWNADALIHLGATPLALPIVACATYATAAELAALRKGDAFVPLPGPRSATDGAKLRVAWPLARGADGGAIGPVMLAPPSFDLGLLAHLGEQGRLVLRGGLEPLLAAEAHMVSEEKDALIEALGEVPVVVRVEIGEALMAARDWATIGRGDVITLGRRVGEAVLLRVGGVPLARGELLDLDGEVAVRIVERLVGERMMP